MYLFGFIIRIYHDARSPERQIHKTPITQDKQKRYFQETSIFMANKIFELSK